jgi:hypothetical protein
MRLRSLALAGFVMGLVGAASPPADDPSASKSPIRPITKKMTGVATKLTKEAATDSAVQTTQTEIVHDLDVLIAQLEKDCAACRNGVKKNRPTAPLADSVIRSGTGGIGDLVPPGPNAKEWAKLSERERDRILQSMSEGFPPEYRTVLERYYRRLAEEPAARTPGAAAVKPSPTDSPE